jgi:hypothetical protein
MRIDKTLSQMLLAGSGCVALFMPARVAWSTPVAAPTLTTLAAPDGSVTLSGSVIPTLNDTATLAGGINPTGVITFTAISLAQGALCPYHERYRMLGRSAPRRLSRHPLTIAEA